MMAATGNARGPKQAMYQRAGLPLNPFHIDMIIAGNFVFIATALHPFHFP